MNAIVPYVFDATPIRVQVVDGQPWFVAVDVCAVLGIAHHLDALARLDEDERGSLLVDTLGGMQRSAAVNESGMWKLVLRSRKPAAKRMVKWLTAEVLPSIRQTGAYGAPAVALDLTDTATLHRLLLDHTGRTLAADERIAELEPQAEALARLARAEGSLCISDAAKVLGASPKRLFAWMEAHSWIYRRSSDGPWIGFQAKIDAKYLEHKAHRQQQRFGPDKLRERVLMTPKGLARLAELRAGL
ncbi:MULTISPECIES: phage antirepressor KilAC domain-containing protein [unclassified Sphingomonas]|uniref:phage antirepressor KilAC domain-containing protein n=1 Tax=unclassified Sphingomonas TaxID=196159 RepID=UPI000B1117BF|nr:MULTISPECIES: phage antirepressor KilAC domain-containing protein [unclassified Sphingomonas]MDY0966940.1 phage antirepressor KilAC domain-containing protein [Sphingomonas sp. CFBP9021]